MANRRMFAFVCLLFVSAVNAFSWIVDHHTVNNLEICSGLDVEFPWKYNTSDEERVVNINWFFQSKDAGTPELLATYVREMFLPRDESTRNVTYLTNAGILLHNASINDNGNFSVEVNVGARRETQWTYLNVFEAPRIKNNALTVRLNAERESGNNSWLVSLTCGEFDSLGQSNVSVIWETPNGSLENSTNYDESAGEFILELPEPILYGIYKCRIDDESIDPVCNMVEVLPNREASLHVSKENVRLQLLEAKVDYLLQCRCNP